MDALLNATFYGPLNYADLNQPETSSLRVYQTYSFTPKTDQVYIQLSGSASSVSPPNFTGVILILNGKIIEIDVVVADPDDPKKTKTVMYYAAARLWDDATPGRNTLVPMSLFATEKQNLKVGIKNVLSVVPFDDSSQTDQFDMFTLAVFDAGNPPVKKK